MDFVLTLHSHLPYVLNHGRWPHGSDWLSEATLDTYLPLLEVWRALAADEVPAAMTLGVTPILANQLASPVFQAEIEDYFEHRLAACIAAPDSLRSTGDEDLVPLAEFWTQRILRLRTLWRTINGDLISAWRALADSGHLELMGSAATHGFLPLLGRDESIQLQLAVGMHEHQRLFGRSPRGCWMPECAYRPRGAWEPWPSATRASLRRGIDEFVADAGFEWTFVDAHLALGGRPLSTASGHHDVTDDAGADAGERSPHRMYGILSGRQARLTTFVRDRTAAKQVWSRHGGYPGDGDYLEFHKQRWPGGLKLWRVTGPGVDLGQKERYLPDRARAQAALHARHFAAMLGEIAGPEPRDDAAVIAAPFDTELFGHWWFEGPDFLSALYRSLEASGTLQPVTGSAYVAAHPATESIRLPEGSWGADGDFSMWINDRTAWTWERLWPLEESFWGVARRAIARPELHSILAQAARSLLLAQSSDWQFIISTGAAADYGAARFTLHCEDVRRLVTALSATDEEELAAARADAERLCHRDDVFPDVLESVRVALAGQRGNGT